MKHIDKLKKQRDDLIKSRDDARIRRDEMDKVVFEFDWKIVGLDMAIKTCEESEKEVAPVVPTNEDVLNCVQEYLKDNPKGINRIGKSIPPKLLSKNFKTDSVDIEGIVRKSNFFTTITRKSKDGKKTATYWILKEDNTTELLK
jgi:hypothetical protein